MPKRPGPFGVPQKVQPANTSRKSDRPEPFQTAQGYVVRGLRLTDKCARSGSPFRLFGTASVGSQSLTGIARLHRLRNDPKLAGVSAVWPFETGWAAKAKWLPAHVLVLHAEIYPSVRDSLPDEIKDRVASDPNAVASRHNAVASVRNAVSPRGVTPFHPGRNAVSVINELVARGVARAIRVIVPGSVGPTRPVPWFCETHAAASRSSRAAPRAPDPSKTPSRRPKTLTQLAFCRQAGAQ
jgi:hypothetical protein